jgi:pyruvate/2-oxoglutarate dehydrogenase complex dihydrolipoamide dehydrogenase (E3) component
MSPGVERYSGIVRYRDRSLVDGETNQILGCACLGLEGGELMNMVEIAMLGKVPYTVLKEAILAHHTVGESLNNLFMALDAAWRSY